MWRTTLALLFTSVATAACASDTTVAPPAATLTVDVRTAVEAAIQDEYHAEETYLRVLADLGNLPPFYNVVYAEQRHSASLALLLERRSLPVPASAWNVNNVPRFSSLSAACAGAAEAEVSNIALYDDLLALDLPADVRTVFQNNRAASATKHLPAFSACR